MHYRYNKIICHSPHTEEDDPMFPPQQYWERERVILRAELIEYQRFATRGGT